ncbi:MAG: hypothetical protein OER77_13900 [Myxococcales bacterium]|nr:hypothetical protein [Myxococcales bacterium]
MSPGEDEPIRRGDRRFVLRLVGAGLVVVFLAFLVLGVLDSSNLGNCAARGFLEVTETPPSD